MNYTPLNKWDIHINNRHIFKMEEKNPSTFLYAISQMQKD